ncbi:MAG: hypothetical protein H6Q63_1001, partial [Firmicutes bacterium]|nr:hypothetical protein [Bacillota bacterium]
MNRVEKHNISNLILENKLLKNALNYLDEYIEIIDPTGKLIV